MEGGSGSGSGGSRKRASNQNVASSSQVYRSAPEASTTSSTKPYQLPEPRTPPGRRNPVGRHRLRSELNRLNQEIQLLKEELKAMENLPPASRTSRELIEFIETCADPLLPITRGPIMAEWDKWFRQPTEPNRCCW
ncbi:hypothetical protein O6H91_02G033000 [Diphasiastrum complanatum]|uniref:Uncharacterized protein n=3 Tax=Diphasiastrum complanatum TaxID=34168 RepID=A0ACC2EEE5_DIPCM|nr:hypothetical protein O6H91_02G019300 [Diphasiastrum complanatum]KAJ7564489.1 hypothetical protein O6H91_02G019300 [Diphasiastrum complanatum]KAJ7564770.1 hypothetical protein O6H91_02G033000 [Diphasiastrum complanatum]